MIPTKTRASILLAMCLTLSLSACDGCSEDEPKGPEKIPLDAGFGSVEFDAGLAPDAGEEAEPKLVVAELEPVFTAVGAADAVPHAIDVQFSETIVDGSRAAGDATLFSMQPAVDGSLKWTTRSTLRFEPSEPLKPATKYTVTLNSIESRDGTLQPAQPWSYEFTTPKFAFLNLSGGVVDTDTSTASVSMTFSTQIDVDSLKDRVEWNLNDKKVKSVTYEQGHSPRVVIANFATKSLAPDVDLKMSLSDGVTSKSGEDQAEGATATVTLKTGPTVELFAVHRKEGADGFYLEVICKDESAPGGTRWYWDRVAREDYRISRRCLPTEDALKRSIRISPKVKNLRVVSGRGGFNILGDFKRRTYDIKMRAGLKTIDGGLLRQPFQADVAIPARTTQIDFVSEGRYLPKSAWKKLAIRHLNAPEAEITIKHIPERNLVFWLTQRNEDVSNRVATVVAKETVPLADKTDLQQTTNVDISNIIGEPEPGIYEIEAKSDNIRDSVRLLMTDMNLIVKRSALKPNQKWPDELFAWVVDMSTTKPVENAVVQAIRPNGEVMSICKTDSEGGCRLEVPTTTLDETPPFAVIARRKNEFTYLKYEELRVSTNDSDVHGEPYISDVAYRATTYSDRGVYRPGETAHFATIVRNRTHRAPLAKVPVEIEIKDARRRVLRKFVEKTNEVGVITFDQEFEDFAPTGAYDVYLRVAKKSVDSYRFNVEEFVPERMEVKANIVEDNLMSTETAQMRVDAKYLFGGSAEGSPVEATCRIESSKFKAKAVKDYTFGRASKSDTSTLDLGTAEAELAEGGSIMMECPALEAGATLDGPGKLIANVAVFEAGSGRSTVAEARANVHPEKFYVGLKAGAQKAIQGESFDVEGIVVDWDGKPYTSEKRVDVEFIRLEREYWWYHDSDEGEDMWGNNIRPVVESTRQVKVGKDGKFRFAATPAARSTAFVVRVKAGKSVTDLKLPGQRRYYYWDRQESRDMTPRPSKPTAAVIEAPEEIEVNQPASFKVQVPFKGRVLMTVETHKVITHEWHDVEAGEFDWKFTLATFTPNVYVSALLVKDPHLDSKEAFIPDRAFGVVNARVRPTAQMQTLKIEAPETIEPNSKLDLTIDVGDTSEPTYVTVAAVDEGILSLTRFKTPDPTIELFAKRALGVDTYETIGWALKINAAGPSSRTGGGGEYDEDEEGGGPARAMPIKPVAMWSGLVKADKNGKAKVSFDVPRYRGALRVMAISSSTTKTGTADTRVTVRDPLVLQTTLPRFLSAGDQIQIPVFATNMTGKAGRVTVSLATSNEDTFGNQTLADDAPMVQITGPATQTIDLEKNESGTVVFDVKGWRQAGVAKFKVEAKLGNIVSYDEGIVPFRPSGPRERLVKRIELKPGTTSLTPQLTGWVPTSERSTIWVTNVPYGESFDHLKYLVRYPYGCIEQTTSSTRPLLFVGQFVDMIDPETVQKGGGIQDMVQYGIKRVLSMQTSEGGFAYWPGGTYPDAWGTAYATHMLLDARDQGFKVPEAQLDRALEWLDRTAENLSNGRAREYYRWAEPYIHYVLARVGKGKKARIQKLITKIGKEAKGQEAEHRFILMAALYLSGDRRYEKEIKKLNLDTLSTSRETRYSYYSDARRRGMMLSTYFDLFGADKGGEPLARIVGESLADKPSHRYTTQEITWSITGLGKWVAGQANNFSPPTMTANGKERKATVAPKNRNDRSWSIYRASEYESLDVSLKDSDGKVYALISSEGVRVNAKPKTGGAGLSISRAFYDLKGNEIEPDQHKLGDQVYVVLKIENTGTADRHNLALVDRFAAAFEVENPRLGRGTLPSWVDEDELWTPDHMNIRDDRMEVFGGLGRGETKQFVYAVRSVSAGSFYAPGPEIEGMYDPEIWARTLPARVKVSGPWDSYLQ